MFSLFGRYTSVNRRSENQTLTENNIRFKRIYNWSHALKPNKIAKGPTWWGIFLFWLYFQDLFASADYCMMTKICYHAKMGSRLAIPKKQKLNYSWRTLPYQKIHNSKNNNNYKQANNHSCFSTLKFNWLITRTYAFLLQNLLFPS